MGKCMTELVDRLAATGTLDSEEFIELLRFRNVETTEYLFRQAEVVRQKYYDRRVTRWGRVLLSNYCKNDCNYCGIRRSNQFVSRYRMEKTDVFNLCSIGYHQGIRHFLLESGVDPSCQESDIVGLIRMMRKEFSDCEIILALGERTSQAYRHWFRSGAGGYLMPQDSADEIHFKRMHSSNMSLLKRKQQMWELREIGYLTGAGFLVGTPYQTIEQVVEDLLFLKQFGAQAVTVVPFVPAEHTPFEKERSGNGEMVLYLLAILRLMLPGSLIIADPSLEQTMVEGRKKALEAGANVIIADISPKEVKEKYCVYHRKPERREEKWMGEAGTWVWD